MSSNTVTYLFLIGILPLGLCLVLADTVDHRTHAITLTHTLHTTATASRPGGTITGIVTFPGKIGPLRASGVPQYMKFCAQKPIEDGLSVNPVTHAVEDVIVYLDQIGPAPKIHMNNFVAITNKDCAFQERVSTIRVGQSLVIRNDDPIIHNLHVKNSQKTVMNLVLAPEIPPITKSLRHPGIFKVQCAIHDFMKAYIGVFPHPYHTKTDEMGAFEITDVPPGKYALKIWHEVLGPLQKTLIVPEEGEDLEVTFEYSTPESQDRQPIILTN